MRAVVVALLLLALSGCTQAPDEVLEETSAAGSCVGGTEGKAPGITRSLIDVDGGVTLLRYAMHWEASAGDLRVRVTDPAGEVVMDAPVQSTTSGMVGDVERNPASGTWTFEFYGDVATAGSTHLQYALYTGEMDEGCGF